MDTDIAEEESKVNVEETSVKLLFVKEEIKEEKCDLEEEIILKQENISKEDRKLAGLDEVVVGKDKNNCNFMENKFEEKELYVRLEDVKEESNELCDNNFSGAYMKSDDDFRATECTFDDEKLDTEKFISEIEKRPALYNVKLKEYSDREVKRNLWKEVANEVIENWNTLEFEEKNKIGKGLQRKWKSLKNDFRKSIKAFRNSKNGQAYEKKRKFMFFDQLQFLIKPVRDKPIISTVNETEEQTSVQENVDIPTRRRGQKEDVPKRIEDISCESVPQENTEDKMGNKLFLLSFLPLLNKLPDNVLIQTRMSMMQVIQQSYDQSISLQRPYSYYTHQHPNVPSRQHTRLPNFQP